MNRIDKKMFEIDKTQNRQIVVTLNRIDKTQDRQIWSQKQDRMEVPRSLSRIPTVDVKNDGVSVFFRVPTRNFLEISG